MKSLMSRLEERRLILTRMIQTLDDLDGEEISTTVLNGLDIDLNHLDKETGATNPAVRPYFLPRNTMPSCRGAEDSEESLGFPFTRQSSIGRAQGGRIFRVVVMNTISSKCLGGRRTDIDGPPGTGWRGRRDGLTFRDNYTGPRLRHPVEASHNFYQKDICCDAASGTGSSRTPTEAPDQDLPDPNSSWSSHEVATVYANCRLKSLPSVTEVLSLLRFILMGVKLQIKDIKTREMKRVPLVHFHHILPRIIILLNPFFSARVLYAYFDDDRLRVQFTEPITFEQFAVSGVSRATQLDPIDWDEHWKNMDILRRWSWPLIQGDDAAE